MRITKILISALLLLPMSAAAQSAIDLYNLNPQQLRGTARFMSMGGAFTALGGDLSTLGQNPAGIGVYRSSDFGITLDIDFQKSKTDSEGFGVSQSQTKAACDNFGYIGTTSLNNSVMPFFSWGASYGRVSSFNRINSGGGFLAGSLSNDVANFTNGTRVNQLQSTDKFNAYNGNAPWMSILAYNAYMINPLQPNNDNCNEYYGLWNQDSYGDATFTTRQSGYADEYNLDFGGNIMNMLYWGLGFGMTDLNYALDTYYDEMIENADIPNSRGNGTENGLAQYNLANSIRTTGNGFNVKFGLIFKPVNELRIGLAVHTPTYYNLTTSYYADVNYEYINDQNDITQSSYDGRGYPSQTLTANYDWSMRTPWKLMFGVAGVIGGQAIISLDYEHQAYNDMSAKDAAGYALEDVNADVKDTFQGSNILRLGGEYRLSRNFSLRAGFNYLTSNVKSGALDGTQPVYTSGCQPAYTLNRDAYDITCGLGFRSQGFYADLAYIYHNSKSKWSGFNAYDFDTFAQTWTATGAPVADITDSNSHLVMTIGYKF